jgi:conserved oligomeric Golgi complex subunit 6
MENLDSLSQKLDEFLPNALMDAHSRLQKLSSPRLANSLTHEAALLFVEDFTALEEAVRKHIEFSQTVFPRSTDEVKLLLGI